MAEEILEDMYVLGQSATKAIQNIGQEIQLDLLLKPRSEVSPNFNKFIIATPSSYVPIQTNAINGTLTNGATFDKVNNFVTNLGCKNNGTVTLSIITSIGGTYQTGIQYVATTSGTTLQVKANSGSPVTTNPLPTTSGLTQSDAKITNINIELNSGTNTVVFYNTNKNAPNIGKLTFKTVSYVKTLPASSATLAGAAIYTAPWITFLGLQPAGQGTATFTIESPTIGNYNFKFPYQSADYARTLQIDINEVPTGTTYTVPKTTSWNTNIFSDYDIDGLLNQGNNVIKFFNTNAYAPNIGDLTVTQQLVLETYEAQDATLALPASVKNGMVTGISYGKGSLTFTAKVPFTGVYDLIIVYVASNDQTVTNMDINGVSTGQTYSFEKTNSMTVQDAKNKVILVTLNAGNNTIKIYNQK